MPRLVVELKATQNTLYEMQYHSHLQGFIYNLLRGSVYEQLHDKKGSKPFTFSNIFPFHNLRQNDIRTFIISSPDKQFIRYMFEILQLYIRRQTRINIGYMTFKINFIQEIYPILPNSGTLITGTPIVIRIPRSLYKRYGYESVYDNYTYWKNEQPLDVFIEQLQTKLLSKYARYHIEDYNKYNEFMTANKGIKLFNTFKFKKQIATNVLLDSIERIVIGSLWEFGFNNNSNRKLVQFALDTGLGERNSLGFGFMNIAMKKDVYKDHRVLEVSQV